MKCYVKQIASEKEITPAQVALGWILAKKDWIVPIPGTTKLTRFEENIASANIMLTEEEVSTIDNASAKINIVGEQYHEAGMKLIDR